MEINVSVTTLRSHICVCVFENKARIKLEDLVYYQSDEWGWIYIASTCMHACMHAYIHTHAHTQLISRRFPCQHLRGWQMNGPLWTVCHALFVCTCVCVSQPLIDGDLLGKTKHRTLKAITSLGEWERGGERQRWLYSTVNSKRCHTGGSKRCRTFPGLNELWHISYSLWKLSLKWMSSSVTWRSTETSSMFNVLFITPMLLD